TPPPAHRRRARRAPRRRHPPHPTPRRRTPHPLHQVGPPPPLRPRRDRHLDRHLPPPPRPPTALMPHLGPWGGEHLKTGSSRPSPEPVPACGAWRARQRCSSLESPTRRVPLRTGKTPTTAQIRASPSDHASSTEQS